jgi:glycosyltransferase involved in cell wall biosynthesis
MNINNNKNSIGVNEMIEVKIPNVSVVLTTFNRVKILSETINSILNQTYSDFEFIIVDNMSEDGTEQYISEIMDQRVRYYRNPNNGVIAVNRNYGIKKARGEYIAFCDDDDLWVNDKLENQIIFMENSPNLALSFGFAVTFGNVKKQGEMLIPKNDCMKIKNFETLLLGNKITCSTVMVKKESLNSVGLFDENPEFKAIEDYDLWLRLARYYPIGCIPKVLCNYRVHTNNTSNNLLNERMKLLKLIEKVESNDWAESELFKRSKSNIYWVIGNALLLERNSSYKIWFIKSLTMEINKKTVLAIILAVIPIKVAYNILRFLLKIFKK